MTVTILLLILNVIVGSLNSNELVGVYVVELVIWVIFAVYYYNRRSEFNRWL